MRNASNLPPIPVMALLDVMALQTPCSRDGRHGNVPTTPSSSALPHHHHHDSASSPHWQPRYRHSHPFPLPCTGERVHGDKASRQSMSCSSKAVAVVDKHHMCNRHRHSHSTTSNPTYPPPGLWHLRQWQMQHFGIPQHRSSSLVLSSTALCGQHVLCCGVQLPLPWPLPQCPLLWGSCSSPCWCGTLTKQ